MRTTESGIVYVATGERHIREATQSAISAREAMPSIPRALFTDDPSVVAQGVFDEVLSVTVVRRHFTDKIEPLTRSPFVRTLYLDTDTRVLHPCEELFDLLDRFDFGAGHAPYRTTSYYDVCPAAFPELNTGVMVFRRDTRVQAALIRWKELCESNWSVYGRRVLDQPELRKVLYDSDLRIAVLPPEYNLRTAYPWFAGSAPVKILHGRDPSLSVAARTVNAGLLRVRTGDARLDQIPGWRQFSSVSVALVSRSTSLAKRIRNRLRTVVMKQG